MKNAISKYGGWILAAAMGAGNLAYPFLSPSQKIAIDNFVKPAIEAIKNEKNTTN